MLKTRRAAAVRPPPVPLTRLNALPTPPSPPILENLHLRVARELSNERLPQIRLISGHDDQGMDLGYARLRSPEVPVAPCLLPTRARGHAGEWIQFHLVFTEWVCRYYFRRCCLQVAPARPTSPEPSTSSLSMRSSCHTVVNEVMTWILL